MPHAAQSRVFTPHATVARPGRTVGMFSADRISSRTVQLTAIPVTLLLASAAHGASGSEGEADAESPLAAQTYAWKRGDNVRQANAADIVDAPSATGIPLEMNVRSAELQVSLGTTLLSCPPNTSSCDTEFGSVAGLAWYHRPATWFSWGLGMDAQQFSQSWTTQEAVWSLRQRAFSGRVNARVHVTGFERIDPYVGISLGGAALRDSYQTQSSPTTTQWFGSPLYGARAGVSVHATDDVHFGGFVDWTNIQSTTGERCPWVVGGVCSSNNWSAFPPSNALWNVGVTVSFAFGDEL